MPEVFYMPSFKVLTIFIMSSLLFQFSLGQTQKAPCSAAEAAQFDFWVGEWNAQWEGGQGTNTVTKILNGCVIHEDFKALGDAALHGLSNSVYNSNTRKWQQTWVDNNGGYLDFSGEWLKDRMILSRSVEKDGQIIFQRMVWYNISKDAFDWNWEISKDTGKTWSVNWKINYKRK